MKMLLTILTILVVCLCFGAGGFYLASQSEINIPDLENLPPPDPLFFQQVLRGLETVQAQQPSKSDWVINQNSSKGVIETNWFPTHKGEVWMKVQIIVSGQTYHLDVWQRLLFSHGIIKTKRSRRAELGIQLEIDKHLTNRIIPTT